MAKSSQTTWSIRGSMMSIVIFCSIIALVLGGFTFLGFRQFHSTLERVLENQVAGLNHIEQVARDLGAVRAGEKELLLASLLMREDRLEEQSRTLWNNIDTLGRSIESLNQLAVQNNDLQRSTQEMAQIQTELKKHFESLSKLILQGKSLPSLETEYQLFNRDVKDLTTQLASVKKTVMKEVELTRASLEDKKTWIFAPAAALALVIIALIWGMMVARKRAVSASRVAQGISAVAEGRFEEVNVRSGDDLEAIARVFNDTMGRLRGSIITQEEREETQKNLIGFLEVVSEASDGDLTVKAPVTADAFGSIADAYNLMVDSLADLMTDTRSKAEEVGSQSRRLLEIFRSVEQGADLQVSQVEGATRAVNETSAATLEIAQKATLAQQASAKVDEVTGQGNARVLRNIEGMQLIRVTVQTINKKMKSLSERLLEIGTISQLISEVATRTTILAMNASIEAARAGDQGRGFLVISDEIKKLADKSAEATKQISGIIKAIQTEAGEVTAALEEETRTVEEQTKLAKDTGDAFTEIENAIGDSKSVVTEIYDLSQNQKNLTGEAVQAMREVSRISAQTMAKLKDSSNISQGLKDMSETLLGALSRFRLPEKGELLVLEEELELEEEEERTALG